MFKAAAIATLATVAMSAKSDYPSFDALHANCGMQVSFTTDCDTTYKSIDSTARSFSPGPSTGLYAVKEETSGDYVWVTRTTPVQKYVDDIMFEVVSTTDGGCTVNAKSRSESLSYYDYDTNYCNMWNVFNTIGGFSGLTTNNCSWVPDVAATTCAKY